MIATLTGAAWEAASEVVAQAATAAAATTTAPTAFQLRSLCLLTCRALLPSNNRRFNDSVPTVDQLSTGWRRCYWTDSATVAAGSPPPFDLFFPGRNNRPQSPVRPSGETT